MFMQLGYKVVNHEIDDDSNSTYQRPPKTPLPKLLLPQSKYKWTKNFDFAKSPIDATIIIRK